MVGLKKSDTTVLIEFTSGPVRFGLVWYGFVRPSCRCRFFGRSFFWRLERVREKETDRQRETLRQRQTDRQTDRQRCHQRDGDREREGGAWGKTERDKTKRRLCHFLVYCSHQDKNIGNKADC